MCLVCVRDVWLRHIHPLKLDGSISVGQWNTPSKADNGVQHTSIHTPPATSRVELQNEDTILVAHDGVPHRACLQWTAASKHTYTCTKSDVQLCVFCRSHALTSMLACAQTHIKRESEKSIQTHLIAVRCVV